MKRVGVERRSFRAAALVLSGGAVALALAATPHGRALAQEQVAQELVQAARTISFNIPAQPLADALTTFGRQSGLQVSVDAGLVRGATAPAVSGAMSATDALSALLASSGLTFRFINATSVTIERPGVGGTGAMALDPVRVQANAAPPQAEIGNLPPPFAGGQVATGQRIGILGERDYMNTPFSTTSYTEQYLRNQQAATLTDAVAGDPSIRAMYASNGLADWLYIRGFLLLPEDMSFNGLFGPTPYYSVNMAGIERVEVFRGPTAMLNGMGPRGMVGGTINLVPKRAGDEDLTRATAIYGTTSQFGGHLDVGRRFGPDKSLGLRANAFFTGGNTAIANQNDNQLAFSLGFDYRGDRTRIDADLGYTNRWQYGSQSGMFLAANVPVPPPPSAAANFYQPWGSQQYDSLYGMMRFEHDVTPDITAFAKVGARRSKTSILDNSPTLTNALGAFTATPVTSHSAQETTAAEVGVRGKFSTGNIRHEAVLSATSLRSQFYFTSLAAPVFASNIWTPRYVNQPFFATPLTGPTPRSDQLLTGISLADNIFMFDDRIQLILGGRAQKVEQSNYAANTGAPATGYNTSALTPALGFVARPWKEVSFYGNYIQALSSGSVVAPPFTNAGTVLPPFVSTQFEVGTKLDLGNFGATLSLFQITRQSVITNPSNNTQTADGQQVNKGIELTLFGEPVKGFRPLGGLTLLDPRQTLTSNGTNNGKLAPGASTVQLNLGADWDVPWVNGLSLMGRVIYTGQSYVDAANLQGVAPWTRVDIGARYTFERPGDHKPVTLRANVTNLFEMNYWMAPIGTITEGAPRTIMLSLSTEF